MIREEYVRSGKFMVPIKVLETHGRLFFKFSYNQALMEEIKCMEGAQYHGYDGAPHREMVASVFKTDKIWSIVDCPRNRFQFEYLTGGNPYSRWDANPTKHKYSRPLRAHQREMADHALAVHYCIWAAEMGTGKTLSAIEVIEKSGCEDVWYIGPKSAIKAVSLEFKKWDSKIIPRMMSYNALVEVMKNWEGGAAPQFVIFDESQKIKTPSALRSAAARALADGVRQDWGDDGYVILMSGSPAPKAPTDWWHQCEVAYPGFLREGTFTKFKFRLGLHEERESFAGGVFHERVSWLDDENKCATCGKYKELHMEENHPWQASVNQIHKLYKRMKGLVLVKFKKDCLDLPEKQYRTVTCPILPSTIRAAKLLTAKSTRAAQALTLLRELSDGFQYVEVEDGEKICEVCSGVGETTRESLKPEFTYADLDNDLPAEEYQAKYYDVVRGPCDGCAGHGKVARYKRSVQSIPCPKDDAVKDIMEEHFEVGRLVIYAGFEGSVNRCVELALAQKWAVVKWDGKGIKVWDSNGNPLMVREETNLAEGAVNPLEMFQSGHDAYPRVVFVGNAGAAGTGLTLTASPSILYYSNSFNAEDRIQSEDRIHRIGMDANRGATIIDLIHLPTDQYVLDNLQKKRKLQDVSLGELNSALSGELF